MYIKYIGCILILSFCYQSSFGKVGKSKNLKFKETTFSFGTFQQSVIVSHEFKFKSISKSKIVIVRASSGCGCTIVDYSQEPLFFGEWGHIKVTYNGKGKDKGYFQKFVNIQTNKEIIRLEINGTMI